MYKNNLHVLPINIKNILLKLLCKRGYIKNAHILKQLINSKVITMDLSECEVTDDFLNCLHICKNLQKLDLSLRRRQTRCITSEALKSLLAHIGKLQILVLPHCKEVNDEVIKVLCNSCEDLLELHIPNSAITDNSLLLIGQKLSHLAVINILGTMVSNKGIEYLVDGPVANSLSEINIDKCPEITSQSNAIIAEKCPNIKIFSCGSCSNSEEISLAMNGIRYRAKQVFWSI